MDGYDVKSSTFSTGIPKFSIKTCVPPVEYKVTFCSCSKRIIGSKPVLSNTEINAAEIFFDAFILWIKNKLQN